MNEAERQSYLKALGLTPWVAHGPMPGAAPSPWLEWPDAPAQQSARVVPAQPSGASLAAPPQRQERPEKLDSPAVNDALSAPEATAVPVPAPREEGKDETGVAPVAATKGLVFTLEAHLGKQTWLLCAQDDSQAPGLGRFEAPLLANLLALFQSRPGRPRRFFCPLTDQPMAAADAVQALTAFIAGLCEQAGGEQVLMLFPESLHQSLFDQPRYQAFELGGRKALVISSLAEMLASPAIHKKASWQAMQENGFDGL